MRIFKWKLLLYLFIVLVSCPVMGQVNNIFKAEIKNKRLYFKLSDDDLNRNILFVRHGVGFHQVVWTKHHQHITLTIPSIQSTSGITIPLNYNYRHSSSIIGRFPIIEDESISNDYTIDVTDLFIQVPVRWNITNNDNVLASLSYVERIQNVTNELIISTQRTTSYEEVQSTKRVVFSFYELPTLIMESRLSDNRMGYKYEDMYSIINHTSETFPGNITRWRLRKKNKTEEISEPIKPIIFYFDINVPDKWKPYIKKGILEWDLAFEAAGFKNAIQVLNFPAKDSLKINQSVNYSMIRWANFSDVRGAENRSGSTVENIIDLQSGEILKSDIIIGSSLRHLTEEYFVRCAPLDVRAQQYPFPESLAGELLQYVTAHEAGHSFGIKDANFGEFAYPIDKIRNKEWLKIMGHTPSIMSYARHNYIAQPKDSIPPSLLIQKVGPADSYQINWGYRTFPEEVSDIDKQFYLDNLIGQQDSIAWFRYNNSSYKVVGPDATNEVVETTDPIQSTKLGLLNIKKVIKLIETIDQNENKNGLQKRLYDKTLKLWFDQMSHVLSLIGGFTTQYKTGRQGGNVHTPIPYQKQIDAIHFLVDNVFDIPIWLSNPEFKFRIQDLTESDKLLKYQLKLLTELIDPYRLHRLNLMTNSFGAENILEELLPIITDGLFNAKNRSSIEDDSVFELQSTYCNLLLQAIKQEASPINVISAQTIGRYSNTSKSLFYQELIDLKKTILAQSIKDNYQLNYLKNLLNDIVMMKNKKK